MKIVVTGGAGFIGSHLTDLLIDEGHDVTVVDNLMSGFPHHVNSKAKFQWADVQDSLMWNNSAFVGVEGVFHLAAIARTPWCIENPSLCCDVNVRGTQRVLEAARRNGAKRVVLASSNVVYAAQTPYRISKEMLEMWARVYHELYGLSTICLRFSNVYGARQSESGPSPNVFASLRKSYKEKGYAVVDGDGEQSRDFTHVKDIARGLYAAMKSDFCGEMDLCTGRTHTLNGVMHLLGWPYQYGPERPGDIKHIDQQTPGMAWRELGWKADIPLEEGIKDVLQ